MTNDYDKLKELLEVVGTRLYAHKRIENGKATDEELEEHLELAQEAEKLAEQLDEELDTRLERLEAIDYQADIYFQLGNYKGAAVTWEEIARKTIRTLKQERE